MLGRLTPSTLNATQYSNQQSNLNHLSGQEGGPCPRLKFECHSSSSGDRVRLPDLRGCEVDWFTCCSVPFKLEAGWSAFLICEVMRLSDLVFWLANSRH